MFIGHSHNIATFGWIKHKHIESFNRINEIRKA